MKTSEATQDFVRQFYAQVAKTTGGCCGKPAVASTKAEELGYSHEELQSVPEGAEMGLGCGNPLSSASLKEGETVLDLGSGGGFDCFLAARQVGESGKVIGVDMTPEMVARAQANALLGHYTNVEFRLGKIEHLPVGDATIDVIISNCVINLSAEKQKVFSEAFRVLKPGGRLAISDVVATGPLPEAMKQDPELLGCCIAGALTVPEIEEGLAAAGFEKIDVKIKPESRQFIQHWASELKAEDYVVSATITAIKPMPKQSPVRS
ncbi:arsenite methyltransferase [Candidatus Methylacidiphilum infernorum]|nr:arsenite methyltransferase [Candidatus Methylacidiphilum infernorum]